MEGGINYLHQFAIKVGINFSLYFFLLEFVKSAARYFSKISYKKRVYSVYFSLMDSLKATTQRKAWVIWRQHTRKPVSTMVSKTPSRKLQLKRQALCRKICRAQRTCLANTGGTISQQYCWETSEVSLIWSFSHSAIEKKVTKLGQWILHKLSECNRAQRVNVYSSMLSHITNELFLDGTMTGEEKWVL